MKKEKETKVKTKIIKNIDNSAWNEFVCWCKNEGLKVGHALSFLIRKKNTENRKEVQTNDK